MRNNRRQKSNLPVSANPKILGSIEAIDVLFDELEFEFEFELELDPGPEFVFVLVDVHEKLTLYAIQSLGSNPQSEPSGM